MMMNHILVIRKVSNDPYHIEDSRLDFLLQNRGHRVCPWWESGKEVEDPIMA